MRSRIPWDVSLRRIDFRGSPMLHGITFPVGTKNKKRVVTEARKGSDGTWRCQVWFGRTRFSHWVNSEVEAKAWLRATTRRCMNGDNLAPTPMMEP